MRDFKPVLILQHLHGDGPAHLGIWLRQHGSPHVVHNTEAGDAFPQDMAPYGALAVLGGEWSANDARPSLRHAEALILDAMARGRPVIGHCLGGQLMARALGAAVTEALAPEIGWQLLEVGHSALARRWLGAAGPRLAFQWHYEAFGLPAGAERLAASAACPNEAFAIGPHLALQFHLEIDAEKLQRWCRVPDPRFEATVGSAPPTVQGVTAMLRDAALRLAQHQQWADHVYAQWLASAGWCF